jgi:Lon protease-like protein
MADLLPIFPLPNVVLFPNVFLPLHIFEPRYREMLADALAADRMIGMVLLRPGWERDYEGRPPVYPIGCSGVVTHAERLPDGRSNIVLRGVERFRIVSEEASRSYRRAVVEPLRDAETTADDRQQIRNCRGRLESMLTHSLEPARTLRERAGSTAAARVDVSLPAAMSDEDLVNALAQYLDFEPLEKQALLEAPCLRSRAASLVELLEMKMMAARIHCESHIAH